MLKKVYCAILVLFISLIPSLAFGQKVKESSGPVIVVSKTAVPPTIDGLFSESEWSEAARITGFAGTSGQISPIQINVYITYDDKNLYFCFISPFSELKKEILIHDGQIWNDDALEIFLDPRKKEAPYYHFVGNANDAQYEAKGSHSGVGWNGDWKLKSSIKDRKWIAEIAIPFSELKSQTPRDGDVWGFNVCRDSKDPYDWLSWASGGGGYHSPERFGKMVFKENGPIVKISSFGNLSSGEISFDGSICAKNSQSAKLEWAVKDMDTEGNLCQNTEGLILEAGEQRKLSIKQSLPLLTSDEPKFNILFVSIKDNSGNTIYRQKIPFIICRALEIAWDVDHEDKGLKVTLDVKGLHSSLREGARGKVTIETEEKVILGPNDIEEFPGALGKTTIDISSLENGNYTIKASIVDKGGSEIAAATSAFNQNLKPVWMGNTLGIDDEVPSPWVPLNISKNAVSCWNRTYEFKDSPFPDQIQIGDISFLHSPIELVGTTQGKQIVWAKGNMNFTERGKSRVAFKVSNSSPSILLKGSVACEFDGMLRLDLELTPTEKKVKIDSLFLKIPVRQKYAKCKYGYGYSFGGGKGIHFAYEKDMIGLIDGPWKQEFLPGLWIGDETRGLTWFAEGQQNWTQNKAKGALEIIPGPESTVFKVNFIDTPVVLDKPLTLTFGLLATPAKPFPRPNDWLTFRPVAAPKAKLYFHGWGGGTRWQGFPVAGYHKVPENDPRAFDDSLFRTGLKKRRSRGLLGPMYLTPGVMVVDIPEVKYHYKEWQSLPEVRVGLDSFQRAFIACTRSREWQDLFIFRLNQFMKEYDVDGINMDWGFPQRCNNESHGCGYISGNARKGTWPLFALHEVNRRIYKIVKKHKGENGLVMGHPVGSTILPHTNFWDCGVMGEYVNVDIRKPPYNADYTAFYSPERMTVEFSGRPFGLLPILMAYTNAAPAAATEAVIALSLVNGTVVWPAWVHFDVLFPVYKALDRFGVADIDEFLPYWSNQEIVETCVPSLMSGSDGIYVSVYKKSKRALLAISNLTPEDKTAQVTVNLARLGISEDGLIAKDAVSEEIIPCQEGSFILPIKNKNFRLIVLRNP